MVPFSGDMLFLGGEGKWHHHSNQQKPNEPSSSSCRIFTSRQRIEQAKLAAAEAERQKAEEWLGWWMVLAV